MNQRKKILVVDDNEHARLIIISSCDKNVYEVIESTNGIEALRKLEENPDIKLLIADLYMPHMDGLSLCEEIRKNNKYSELKIIMVTTDSSNSVIERGRQANIQAWISKPFKKKHLHKIIAELSK